MWAALVLSLWPQAEVATPSPLVPESWLVLAPVDARGRRPVRPDAVFAAHLLARDSAPPEAGAELAGERGRASWEPRAAASGGGPAGDGPIGYAFAALDVPEERAGYYLARLAGAFDGWIDGDPIVGDAYRYGFGGVPVWLAAGERRIYVSGVRGGFDLSFEPLGAEPSLVPALWDLAAPELGEDDRGRAHLVGLPLFAASRSGFGAVRAEVLPGGDFVPGPAGALDRIAALGPAHLALEVRLAPEASESSESSEAAPRTPWKLPLELRADGLAPLRLDLTLGRREAAEPRLRTYRSRVDGAVLPYGLLAPSRADFEPGEAGLVLSLHGASVRAEAQIRSYSPKPDLWIAAPTNRRPFGFDWQDWGRWDAFEVAALVEAEHGLDPARRGLTGHSMGGHGTWHLAAWDASAFAAAAPSAGWESFDTYGGRPDGELAHVWRAADRASETRRALAALVRLPLYVLHGDADRTVPVEEARRMIELLSEAGHEQLHWHLEPGAGHWWDGSRAAGADCVDWPPLFDLLAASRRDLVADFSRLPEGDGEYAVWRLWLERPDGRGPEAYAPRGGRWIDALALDEAALSGPDGPPAATLEGTLKRTARVLRLEARTEALTRLAVRLHPSIAQLICVLDGGPPLYLVGAGEFEVERRPDGHWRQAGGDRATTFQRPGASGPFKRGFDRDFLWVVGTTGTPEESRELAARARQDQLAWHYRAAGAPPFLTDRQFLAGHFPGRNLILYGNRDTNAAFAALLPETAPFDARRGLLRLGTQRFEAPGLAALTLHPRPGGGLLTLLADTGPPGTRLTQLSAHFLSGAGFPDYLLFGPEVLTQGDPAVLTTGRFDESWNLPGD